MCQSLHTVTADLNAPFLQSVHLSKSSIESLTGRKHVSQICTSAVAFANFGKNQECAATETS